MEYDIFCEQLGLTPQGLAALLDLDPTALLHTPVAQRISDSISLPLLHTSLPEAQELLKHGLPDFYAWLARDLGVTRIPSSPDHVIEWIGDLLLDRRTVIELIDKHAPLSSEVLARATPRFVALFDDLALGREDWYRATALICLVLLAGALRREAASSDSISS